jgi:hypothetical protein
MAETFDFQSLGLDRLSQNIKRAITNPSGNRPNTGDITGGEVVEVSIAVGDTTGSAIVGSRRTGALPLQVQIGPTATDHCEYKWGISDETLTVAINVDTRSVDITFWVF